MKERLLVVGAGGHAKVVVDIALSSGRWQVVGILDDTVATTKSVLGCPILGTTELLRHFAESRDVSVVVAIGSNEARQRIQTTASTEGLAVAALVHPAAVVANSVTIGSGSVVMAGAVINASAVIGEGVIVNTGALIDHDCVVGDYSHIAPGASLCGGVSVGPRSLIGVGASVIPGISIGSDCVIGAGAAVIRPVGDRSRVAGVPARDCSKLR